MSRIFVNIDNTDRLESVYETINQTASLLKNEKSFNLTQVLKQYIQSTSAVLGVSVQ